MMNPQILMMIVVSIRIWDASQTTANAVVFFGRGAHVCEAPKFYYNTSPAILSREKLHKYQENKNPDFVHSTYCILWVDVV